VPISENIGEICEKKILLVHSGVKCNFFFIFPNNFALFWENFQRGGADSGVIRRVLRSPDS